MKGDDDDLAPLSRWGRFKQHIVEEEKKWLHSSFKLVHTSYFGVYMFEGHGMIMMVATALFAYSILDLFIHFEGG